MDPKSLGIHKSERARANRVDKKTPLCLNVQGKKEKVFKKEMDEDLAALVIIAFHDGILIRWFMNQSEIDGEAYVNTFKKIMLNGLMA